KIIAMGFLFAGGNIAIQGIFQALGCAVYSMFVSIARQLVVLLPAAYLLSLSGNLDYVWWAFPIAELMSLCMTIIFLFRVNKKIISRIGLT
ncbi:MAG: MATE family efflux transporter, partial [Lachnospiraceae bacterium]|nr:MATE family efflux transporter [Lachnospiraceae bacterium]